MRASVVIALGAAVLLFAAPAAAADKEPKGDLIPKEWNPFLKQQSDVKAGNADYADGRFDQALGHYDEAVKGTREAPEARFNRGDTLYKQGKFDQAGEEFARAAAGGDRAFKSKALYNIGNVFAKAGKSKEAVDAYIKSLMLDPKNADAKYNLELMLRQDEPPPPPPQQNPQDTLDKMKEQEKPMQMKPPRVKDKEVEKDW